ncbi:tetratricopeptide repeat protein [Synechococcus sp. UW140]|uniref:tetratricopeptide repeat protein n=1 Tax=Synechococcus sp. UW140 TaxID=368503 RepID=UPI00313814D2
MAEHLLTAPETREIRVFLSSTFRDFNEERKLLATEVFPELNRKARERGVELVEVDLRWGVTQQQAEGGHALGICLREIERCKPYFIGMLGDSYGSLTPPQRQLLQAEPALLDERSWLEGQIGSASYTELEIQHGLALLRRRQREQQEGHAFFYFRDPAYSDAKADAGEAGWRSDDSGDRQKLEQLLDRIRNSCYPLVEGLADPQAIADQIKADLWALIERQFPEGAQPNALEKEARKHADYRQMRCKPGQYIGGDSYIQLLEEWLEQGQQQILITGESGAGKSALIANWMEQHSKSNPTDVVYAHHLGCTNDANALRPMLGRLIDTASVQLLEAGLITEALAVPEDWWELVAKLAETLQSLGLWCKQNGQRWILVLDGLDRLDLEGQQALAWLPQNLPENVFVITSALICPVRQILSERRYLTLTIKPLGEEQQEQLIQSYLVRYTKELDGGLRQLILAHPQAGSPLFLKVLLEELRQCGRHDTLEEQLGFYLSSKSVDDLYERVLERLENDGSGDVVRKVLTALWASRAGLTETELLEITELARLQWTPIDLALEKAFGRNGNRLVFDHDYLRIAVEDRYLPTEEQKLQAHSELADWFEAKEEWDERDSEELPWQLQEAARFEDLRGLLLTPWALAKLARDRGSREVINYWLVAKEDGGGELDELIADAVEKEIEKRKDDAGNLIWFIDRIAGLLDEAGLYRELLLRLRTTSLELEEATEGRDEESILSSLSWLASAHSAMGNYNEAELLYLRFLEVSEILLGAEHPDTLTSINNLALLYHNKGEYEKAEAFYNRCLEARERLLGAEHPDTLISINNLASLYNDKGEYEKAEPLYNRCLEASERLLGAEHPDTLTCINNLAGLYSDKGEYEKAEVFYNRCLEASERLLGPEHPDTLTCINNLAGLYSDKGEYEKAEAFYNRCLEARERLLGPEHPNTLTSIGSLASLYYAKGEYEKSEALYKRCLEAQERLLGPEHLDTLISINNLAYLYSSKGEYEKAEALYNRCLEASERLLGPEHPKTLTSINNLANLYSDKGEYEKAEAFFTRCLEARERLLGPEHHDTNNTRYSLADLFSQQQRQTEAIPLRRRELAWCRKQNGDTDPGTLTSINALAIDLRETRELEEAETLFRELVTTCQQVLEPGDFQIGRALRGLARTLEEAGKLEDAVAFAHQALDHRHAHEGPDAWVTNRNRLDLAQVLHKLGRSAEALSLLDQLQHSMGGIAEPEQEDLDLIEAAVELRGDICSGELL